MAISFGAGALAVHLGHVDAALLVAASCSALALLLHRTIRDRQVIAELGLRLAERERFVARAAHELRAPLTVVYGQLALALRRPRDEHEYRAAIEEALESATELRALTEDLLDLAGAASAGSFEPTSVARVARCAVRHVRGDAERASVTLDLRVEDARVPGRAPDLERLLRNLVENAVRHSPPGGRVLVEASAHAGGVVLAVGDEGPGVPEGERARLFEPFFRGVHARGSRGAGLGLAIVREIARAHGGDVQLDAHRPRGARFVVRLPLWQPPAGDIGLAPLLLPGAVGSGRGPSGP
jgi:two-component system heavy metal sensor histidine kinase CusS